MYDNLTQLIKKIAKEAWEAAKPSNIITGTVLSTEPLSIQTDQKIILEEEFITVPEKLTDYEMEISFTDGKIIQGIDIRPEGGDIWNRQEIRISPPVRHKIIIHNALKSGDGVIMAVDAGGQRHFVIDRTVAK